MSKNRLLVITALLLVGLVLVACGASAPAPEPAQEEAPAAEEAATSHRGQITAISWERLRARRSAPVL